MPTNFDFLKTIDRNLYEIISDAEMLYRDEYFEQCITQTRKFAENICKNVLGSKRTTEKTFEQMLATLKDNAQGTVQEKEFIEDLYFLKKCGNQSVHSSVKKDAINALECLKRAFEAAINYSIYNKKSNKKILELSFDIEFLAAEKSAKAGVKSKNKSKSNKKYLKAKDNVSETADKRDAKKQTVQKQVTTIKSCQQNNKISKYWIAAGIFSLVLVITALFLLAV